MKSAVESLSATRIKLTVEVPFAELKPSFDAAYKKIANNIRVPGFRVGKVPPPIIDRQVGREVVLEEALNEALPKCYGEAVQANELRVVGQPSVDVTQFADREPLIFTAEVDVRPEITVPDYDGLSVVVDDADVTDEQIDEQVTALAERFATLSGVERAAAAGDFVVLDLEAAVDDTPLPELTSKGQSYEVGSEGLLPGLDEAVTGLAAGESATFEAPLVGGDYAGKSAAVTVTVTSVREKSVPALDDTFAGMASEFDTLAELRADIAERVGKVRLLDQGAQARDRAVDALMALVDVPTPQSMVDAEAEWRHQSLEQQLAQVGGTMDDYFASLGTDHETFDADLAETARKAVAAQLLLDAVAAKEELGIDEAELSEQIVQRAYRAGVSPQQYADLIMEAGNLPALMGEILRGKAIAAVLEHATITDASGRPVDLAHIESVMRAAMGSVAQAGATAEA